MNDIHGDDDLVVEVFLGEDDEDILLLDEFENDDTEDVSLSETLDSKVAQSENGKSKYYPDGWSYKRKSRKLISPSGEMFKSRGAALKAMTNSEEYSMGEIEEMRSSLRHERWRESEDLPRCWMIRDGNDGPEILGAGGEFFKTLTEAAEFVRKYEEYFYQEDLEKFWIFVQNATVKKSGEMGRNTTRYSEGWQTDPLLPADWQIKKLNGYGGSNHYFLLSPHGKIFQGKRQALKYIIKENYPNKDVEKFRDSIRSDGYKTLESLPTNWLYKKIFMRLYFIDPKGNGFDSKEKVIKILQSSPEFDHIKFLNSLNSSCTEEMSKWVRDDPTVPEGWKTKEFNLGKVKYRKFISPNGLIFRGARNALRYLIQNSYPESEIMQMRLTLKTEGWEENDALPPGWVFKFYKKTKSGRSGSFAFIDKMGNKFKGMDDAKRYLLKQGDLSTLSVLENFIDLPKRHKTLIPKKTSTEIKGIDEMNGKAWTPDISPLPFGWKIRPRSESSAAKYTVLESADGKIFQGKRQALKFLIAQNFPEHDIKLMRLSLKSDGWEEDDSLPPDWMFKREKEDERYSFIDNLGNRFKSREVAKRYILKNGDTSFLSNLEDFKRKRRRCLILKQKEKEERQTLDPIVPPGWLIKHRKDGMVGLVSPDGTFLIGRIAALKHLVENNYPKEQILALKDTLKYEGWSSDPKLPQDWLYKSRLTKLNFIDESGHFFQSKEAACKVLAQKNHLEDLALLVQFRSESFKTNHQRLQNLEDSSWTKDDPTVPSGWKIKKKAIGKQNIVKVMSPDGLKFPSRRMALKFMIEKLYPVDQIEEIRDSLKHENWLQDSSLPEKWLYKKNRNGGYCYINHNGHFLKSKSDVELVENGGLSTIAKFLESKVKIKKHSTKPNSLRNMIKNRFPEEEIDIMRSSLITDGWSSDKSLPEKWLYKKQTRNRKERTCFINEEGSRLKNRIQATKYLRQKGRHEDVKKVNKFIFRNRENRVYIKEKRKLKEPSTKQEDQMGQKREIKTEEWIDYEEECLKGWKLMISASGSKHYRTPSGEVLRNKPQISIFLKNNNFSEETVASMMKGISNIDYKRKRDKFSVRGQKQRVILHSEHMPRIT